MNGNELNSTTPNKEINSGFMNPKCSCSECDSVDCFVARNTKAPCSCVKCTNSKICFHYSNRVNMNERNSEINIAKKTNSLVNPKNTIKNEYVEKEVIEDLNNNNNTKSSAVSKKQSKNSEIATDRKTDFHFESDKDERPYTHVHSASIKISRTNLNPATADLSAQIMNVPYQDFKNSLSVNKSDNSYKGKMIKYDILTRIKEAYKACSCKVCECVIGKSHTRNEFCKCRPCDCNDCTSLLSKINSVKGGVHFLPVDGCPCIRCSRPQCKGIVNKFNEPQICDCEACDCIKCTTDSFNKLCNCQPCQCVECNAMSIHLPTTFIVAPVGEDYQRNVCQCSPCDCIECGHGYGMSSNLRHEMSTGINIRSFCHCEACVNEACEAEGIDSCKCQRRNKIMMKPVKKDVHDYDIRTISTKEYSWRHNDKKCTTKSDNDTIAMFATLPDQYVAKYDNMKKRSDSEKCKCLDCNCNENAVDSIKSSQLFKAPIFSCLKDEACKCSPCECQVYFDSTIDKETSSKCKVRDCFNCQSLTKTFMCIKCSSGKLINKLSSKGICKNRSGPCVICRKLMHSPGDTLSVQYGSETRECYSNEDIYPIKRAKLLTPSILNGIERENEDSNNESYSSNLDDLLKISEWTLRQLRTNIQNQSHKDISANDIFQKSHSERTAERQLSSNSILVSGVSPETNTSDIKKLNIEVNKDADFLNTDLKKSEASFSELYENIVNVKQTVYERIKMEDKLYSKDRFNSSSIINDFSYNYNATSLSKSITNCNKHINFCVSLNDEESIQADTFNSNAYNQGNINNMYYDRNSTTRNYKLSGASNNIMKNRSRGIILSDPQFNLNRDRHEVVKHVLKYAFKNKNHSMINRGQLVNASVDKDIIFLSLRANFERAQKTLHEAKIYSTNLLKILEKYEKANTEFQSISEKLKLKHDLLKGDSFEFAHVPFTESKTNNNNNINTMANEIEYGAKKQRIRIIDELMDFNLKDLTTLEPVKLEKKDNSRLPTNFVRIPDIKNQKNNSCVFEPELKTTGYIFDTK